MARQLRLRDLAGLVVIDFIDMEEKRNNRSVEKKLKDCLKNDRARIQVGRISHFGLLEMSRQRIRASVLESTTQVCQHCGGTGHVRSESSIALHVLRGVEEYLLRNTTHNITVRCTPETALYLLNHKRGTIVDYEGRFGVSIIIAADAGVGAQHFAIDRGEAVENPVKIESLIQMLPNFVEEEDDFIAEVEEDEDEEEIVKAQTSEPRQQQPQGDNSEEGKRKRKRRRRRRGKGGQGDQNGALDAQSGDAEGDDAEGDDDGIETDEADAENENGAADAVGSEEDGKRKRRRRGKRGGRRNRAEDEALDAAGSEAEGESESEEVSVEASVTEEPTAAAAVEGMVAEVAEEEVPKKPRRTRKAKVKTETEEAPKAEAVETVEPVIVEETVAEVAVEEAGEASADLAPEAEAPATEEKVRANRGSNVSSSEPVVTSSSPNPDGDEPKPRKGGWWQRKGFF